MGPLMYPSEQLLEDLSVPLSQLQYLSVCQALPLG